MAAILAAQYKHFFSNENHYIFLQMSLDFGLVTFTVHNILMQYISNHTLLVCVIKYLKELAFKLPIKRHNKTNKSSLDECNKERPKMEIMLLLDHHVDV